MTTASTAILANPRVRLYPSGRYFTPFDPRPEDIDIRDIAHGLSRLNRHSGHTEIAFNGAHHSLIVSFRAEYLARKTLVPAFGYPAALSGLLHDAPEPLGGLGDVRGPVKHHPFLYEVIRRFEGPIERAIAEHFGLPIGFAEITMIKDADRWAAAWEDRDVRGIDPDPPLAEGQTLPSYKLDPLSDGQARNAFLCRYIELAGERGRSEAHATGWSPGPVEEHIDGWRGFMDFLRRAVAT